MRIQQLVYQFKKNEHFIGSFIITLFLFIFTFPQLDLTFSHGIDEPLIWVYNWLFKNDFTSASTILFPHGPLDFLSAPLSNTLWLFLFVDFFVKYIFVLLLYFLNKKMHKSTYLFYVVFLAYLFFITSNAITISLFSILFAFIVAFETNSVISKYLAFILIAFCFYFKTYTAIIALGMGLAYLIYTLIQTKNIKHFFTDIAILFGIIILTFVLLFQKLDGFISFLLGIINLSVDNSSACSFYPENNWWYIIFSMLIAVLLPFINRKKQGLFYGFMMIFPLFAVFKHGMARQEGAHLDNFWLFLLLNFICLLFYLRKQIILNSVLICCSLILLFLNFNYKSNHFEIPINKFISINNFINFISNYNEIINQAEKKTEENIVYRKVSNQLKQDIGTSSVDVYPWDYSIIAANNFKWHPRPIINSYAAYTSWLDKQDAAYFESDKAPEYFIWDFSQGISPSSNESEIASIDGRYLLNDEPQTILSLLSNYKFIKYENTLNIYKRRKKSINYYSQKSSLTSNLINTWISIPKITNEQVLRANVFFKRNILQKLKSFFYKDEQYWVYLKFSDNTIQKIKIVPKNAKNGIWLSPFIYKPTSNAAPLIVKEIMFKNSNQEMLPKDFDIQFEVYDFDTQNVLHDFFPKSVNVKNSVCFEKKMTFDMDDDITNTLNFDKNNLTKKGGLNSSTSFLLLPNQFSPSFKVNLDSFNFIELKSSCWVNLLKKDALGLSFVIDFRDENDNQLNWISENIPNQVLNKTDWNFCSQYMQHSFISKHKKINFCLWDTSNDTILFDDLYLKIIGRKD
jgi:hypothetical protein